MSKVKCTKWNTIICETSTKMAIVNSNELINNIYPNLPKITFVHNMNKKNLYLKRAPFKYPKWKFASEIGHFVSLSKLTQNLLQFQNKQI